MKKTYFISDAHLGSRIVSDAHEHERKLVTFLDSIKADAKALYLMGDMFDFWFEYKSVVPKGFVRVLGKLAELADSGIELHYFTGNHDLWTFGYLESEIGMHVYKQAKQININGKECFLAHGDGLHTKEKKFLLLRKIFHSRTCQLLFGLLPSGLGLSFGLWWSEKNRQKVLHRENRYFGEANEELVLFAKQHEKSLHIDYYIFGHRHLMLDLMLATGSRVVILGDFIHYFSYAVMDENGELSLEQIAEKE